MLLFAYGTLINPKKAERILKTRKAKKAYLPGYKIVFNVKSPDGKGNPNIERGGNGVWGVVYEVDEKILELLDKVSPRYKRTKVEVIVDGEVKEAWTFIGKNVADVSPDPSCVESIIEGAKYHGLPEDYVSYLKKVLFTFKAVRKVI
uniref:Gamma-glutamylcyclotransferase n=3 Tax=Geoglobus ahangari TaxID=113653 RepID=A0A7C3YMT0_9EURY